MLALALVALVAASVAGIHVDRALSSGGFDDPGSESSVVRRELQARLGFDVNPGLVVLARAQRDVRATPVRSELTRLATEIARDPDVGAVLTYYAGPPGLISRDGRSTYLVVNFRTRDPDRSAVTAARIRTELKSRSLRLSYGGYGVWFREGSNLAVRDLRRAELIVLPLLALLLVVVFRGVVAAALPLLLAVFALAGTYAGLRAIDATTALSAYALNLASPLALSLGIDYSLFLVSRYREELGRAPSPPEALRVTLATAGRTVLFSSLTVAVAMAGLLVFPQQFLYSMGLAGVFVALIAGGASLTVVPALLAVLGPRIDALAWPRRRDGWVAAVWSRLPRAVVRHPGPAMAIGLLAVAIAAAPATRATFTTFDSDVLPSESQARQVHETIRTSFPAFHDGPVLVLVRGDAVASAGAIDRTRRRLASLKDAGPVTPLVGVGPNATLFEVVPRAGALESRSVDLVERVRASEIDAKTTGRTAELVDSRRSIANRLPLALAVIALATVPLLIAMTGSAILPLVTLGLNLLTVAAAFGFIVIVFQDGRFERLLDYHSQAGVEINQAVLLLAVIFGISTDYGVFLLARVKEFLDAGLGVRRATESALLRTGRLISAAAAVVCVAVGALVTSSLAFLKADGLGIAFAIAFDAAVVRLLLIPAILIVLGRRAWWAPPALRRLHDRFSARSRPMPVRPLPGAGE